MDKVLRIEIPISVSQQYSVLGVVNDFNGCCPDRPILITGNKLRDHINYSCQCACGMWCTNGHITASEALQEYEEMTRRKNND